MDSKHRDSEHKDVKHNAIVVFMILRSPQKDRMFIADRVTEATQFKKMLKEGLEPSTAGS